MTATRAVTAIVSLAAALQCRIIHASPPCKEEPVGGFPLQYTCNNQCTSNSINFSFGPPSIEESEIEGPGILKDSSYRVAAFYFGHQY
mmetsp:Transcript_21582/g.26048  ORF Transcript_21582/g.26048 Transcript_21582/m.26048 type:complete len:88 (+) Transcript_21582:242-505(+)